MLREILDGSLGEYEGGLAPQGRSVHYSRNRLSSGIVRLAEERVDLRFDFLETQRPLFRDPLQRGWRWFLALVVAGVIQEVPQKLESCDVRWVPLYSTLRAVITIDVLAHCIDNRRKS